MEMKRTAPSIYLVGLVVLTHAADELPRPAFYCPFDGDRVAVIAAGKPTPSRSAQPDAILTEADAAQSAFIPGKVGQAYNAERSPLVYACKGNFRADEGTCSMWLRPAFRGDDKSIYCTFFGAANWGMLYKYLEHTSLTLGTAKPERDLYYDCNVPSIAHWRPGEWHHVAVTWSRSGDARCIYVDGQRQAQAPFPYNRPVDDGPLFIGAGCTLYPEHVAHSALDEVAIWAQALTAEQVRLLFECGQRGEPLLQPPEDAPDTADRAPELPWPATAAPESPARTQPSATRDRIVLDGWWHFLPDTEDAEAVLPAGGHCGQARIPGYWTAAGEARGLDGKPLKGRWGKVAFGDIETVYCRAVFAVPEEWTGRTVLLELGGIDGTADLILNGRELGRLLHWESGAYDVSDYVLPGRGNTLTLSLHKRGGSNVAGFYDHVAVNAVPDATVRDIVVRAEVRERKVHFSCDVWSRTPHGDATLEFTVSEHDAPDRIVRRFTHQFQLEPPRQQHEADIYERTQRVDATFPWPDAKPWTIDQPVLYRVRARLSVRGEDVDESPWSRFGFRDFAVQGADFLLNGVPIHLRGQQIDLGWSDQMSKVEEMKDAGMNAFEFSGPIRHNWYTGVRYRLQSFDAILDHADTHGLIALPILPDAKALQDRLFEPDVAKRYQRRIDKHVRRFGNHPSVCMWYMHFNLAGYRWYHPPTKIDGSYKPDNAAFLAKERYALEAQRLAQERDWRPLYHHACGNLGDLFTLNCYIGPTSPLQEREEWPSRWAAKRPFPLLACEHGLMLIPYWFRPRKFPLSEVYSDEPIFDEITVKYVGPSGYWLLNPDLFELYDIGRKPRSTRTRALIRHHQGYQRVKSLFARHSLRAWRTYGVSGVLFNAINWDFRDDDGQPLPVMEALARYFGDTDLFISGPGDDWPSKDHACFSGETIQKQVVLLNDLGRDLRCAMVWVLMRTDGTEFGHGKLEGVARAGVPTFVPFSFVAPDVTDRSEFLLSVLPTTDSIPHLPPHFQRDQMPLTVFPRKDATLPTLPAVGLYDPVGDTTELLRRAGVRFTQLDADTDLAKLPLLVVGRKAYDDGFMRLAQSLQLEDAVAQGLNVLVLEQTVADVFGLRLEEQSARRVFPTAPQHGLLAGLAPGDFTDLRGRSDLVEPYPDAPPETEQQWPKRYFKWGNRGVVATYVFRKPHLTPFVPLLECGFDLVDSPLLEARLGRGRIVLCQVDVTNRYGADPVSTTLVRNLLRTLSVRRQTAPPTCAAAGQAAAGWLQRFGVVSTTGAIDAADLLVLGSDVLDVEALDAVKTACRKGATVLLLPGLQANAATRFGLSLTQQRFFIGRVQPHLLTRGLNDGDLFMKRWTTVSALEPAAEWDVLVEPGLLGVKQFGKGRIVACRLPVNETGDTRLRVKTTRFWNVLLANLGAPRAASGLLFAASRPRYLAAAFEDIPPFINW